MGVMTSCSYKIALHEHTSYSQILIIIILEMQSMQAYDSWGGISLSSGLTLTEMYALSEITC